MLKTLFMIVIIPNYRFFLSDFTPDGDPWILAFLMFQVVFAATAAIYNCIRCNG